MHCQVTHALSWHLFECLSLVSSYVGGSVFFSHPTRSLFFLVFPPLISNISRHKCVWHKCVFWISIPHQHLSVCMKISQKTYLYTNILPSFTLVYSQTHSLEARLWGSEITAKFPTVKKRALHCLQIFESVFKTAHWVHMAVNVGPKSTISHLFSIWLLVIVVSFFVSFCVFAFVYFVFLVFVCFVFCFAGRGNLL